MKEIWKNLKEEIIFNYWCKAGLISTSNSVVKNPELEASSEIRETETYLPIVLPSQFHSPMKRSMILDE